MVASREPAVAVPGELMQVLLRDGVIPARHGARAPMQGERINSVGFGHAANLPGLGQRVYRFGAKAGRCPDGRVGRFAVRPAEAAGSDQQYQGGRSTHSQVNQRVGATVGGLDAIPAEGASGAPGGLRNGDKTHFVVFLIQQFRNRADFEDFAANP